MKERPILFSGPMVRALLDGSKTQTRRVVKPQPQPNGGAGLHPVAPYRNPAGNWAWVLAATGHGSGGNLFACPYGQPGDRLWVRETWGVVSNAWDEDGNLIDWVPDRPAAAIHEMPFGQGYYSGHVIYAADGPHEWAGDDDGGGEPRSAWRPSIHMPRAASRILLEIVSVHVERLQEISQDDARAEGITDVGCVNCGESEQKCSCDFPMPDPRDSYVRLWESINGPGSWEANPWVWVVEFKPIAPSPNGAAANPASVRRAKDGGKK